MTDQNQGASIEAAASNLRDAKANLDREQARVAGSHAHVDAANQYQFAVAGLVEAALAARRTPAAAVGAGDLLPLPSMKAVDDIVYKCRQSGKDTTYDIVHAAIEADRAQRQAAPASAQPAPQVGDAQAVIGGQRWSKEAEMMESWLAAPQALVARQVPDGYALVPKVMTPEMHITMSGPILQSETCKANNQYKWERLIEVCPATVTAPAQADDLDDDEVAIPADLTEVQYWKRRASSARALARSFKAQLAATVTEPAAPTGRDQAILDTARHMEEKRADFEAAFKIDIWAVQSWLNLNGFRPLEKYVRRAAPAAQQAAPTDIDVRHEFELYKSNLGEAVDYIGDGLYGNIGVNEQSDAFRAGVAVGRRAAPATAGMVEDAKDAARFRDAIALEDCAEALYVAVLNHAPDTAVIRDEFDEYLAAQQAQASARSEGGEHG